MANTRTVFVPNLCIDDVIIMQIVIHRNHTSDPLSRPKGLLFSNSCVNTALFSTHKGVASMSGMSHDV